MPLLVLCTLLSRHECSPHFHHFLHRSFLHRLHVELDFRIVHQLLSALRLPKLSSQQWTFPRLHVKIGWRCVERTANLFSRASVEIFIGYVKASLHYSISLHFLRCFDFLLLFPLLSNPSDPRSKHSLDYILIRFVFIIRTKLNQCYPWSHGVPQNQMIVEE